ADAVRAQQVVELGDEVRRVADLEGVTIAQGRRRLRERAALETRVMAPGEPLRLLARPRQQPDEGLDALGVEAVAVRELPEERARLASQGQDAARVEVGQGRLRAAQLEVVRDEPAPLHREHEAAGRRL